MTVANCGPLSAPDDGQVSFEPDGTTVFRSRAVYSCNTGFTLDGDKTRVCREDETWSGSAPTCVRKLKKQFVQSFSAEITICCMEIGVLEPQNQ